MKKTVYDSRSENRVERSESVMSIRYCSQFVSLSEGQSRGSLGESRRFILRGWVVREIEIILSRALPFSHSFYFPITFIGHGQFFFPSNCTHFLTSGLQ